MATKPLPSQEVLRQLLDYDPETGALTWRERERSMFRTDRQFKTWNARYAGAPALGSVDAHGYLVGSVLGSSVKAHRVIAKLVSGVDPDCIDHINGDRSDNRWSNLRGVSHEENGKNQARRRDVTSGATGVCWGAHVGKWMSYIWIGGRAERKRVHLGLFDDFDAALVARKEAEAKYGFHENHGRAR